MEPIKGIHLGLVVSSSPDPESRNRIQVWVPHLSNTLYEPLNQKLKNVSFKSPEDLNKIDLSILEILQTTLPWAECGAPLFGGSSGAFNSATGQTAVNSGSTFQSNGNAAPFLPTTTLNMTSSGMKPVESGNVGASQLYRGVLGIAGGFNRQPKNGWANGVFGHWCEAGASAVASALMGGDTLGNKIDSQLGANAWDSRGLYSNIKIDNQQVWNKPVEFSRTGASSENLKLINNATPGTVLCFHQPGIDPKTGEPYVGHTLTYAGNGYWSSDNTADNPEGSLNNPRYDSVAVVTPTDYGKSIIAKNWPTLAPYDGKMASAFPVVDDKANSGAKNVVYTDRSAAVGCVPSNVGLPGSPVGTFSIPNAGTKVWVFFMGGDVQRPVYFAQSPNPGDVKALAGS